MSDTTPPTTRRQDDGIAPRPPPGTRGPAAGVGWRHPLHRRGSALRRDGMTWKDRGFGARPIRIGRQGRRIYDTSV